MAPAALDAPCASCGVAPANGTAWPGIDALQGQGEASGALVPWCGSVGCKIDILTRAAVDQVDRDLRGWW